MPPFLDHAERLMWADMIVLMEPLTDDQSRFVKAVKLFGI